MNEREITKEIYQEKWNYNQEKARNQNKWLEVRAGNESR